MNKREIIRKMIGKKEKPWLLYEFEPLYEGKNPLGLRMEVCKAGDTGIYNEVAVDCYGPGGLLVGSVLVGLDIEKKDMRVLLTTDGEGGNEQKVAVYPQRPRNKAVDTTWDR